MRVEALDLVAAESEDGSEVFVQNFASLLRRVVKDHGNAIKAVNGPDGLDPHLVVRDRPSAVEDCVNAMRLARNHA